MPLYPKKRGMLCLGTEAGNAAVRDRGGDGDVQVVARRAVLDGDLAIAWVLRRPEVTAAIVGARSPWQIEEVAKVGDWRLTAQELAEIEALLARRAQTVA